MIFIFQSFPTSFYFIINVNQWCKTNAQPLITFLDRILDEYNSCVVIYGRLRW
jgi:hypothetical protein